MKEIAIRDPINKTAYMIVSSGVRFNSTKKNNTIESDSPLGIIKCKNGTDITGKTFGRFTVIGVLDCEYNYNRFGLKRKWVVKCICGKYAIRRARAIENKNNKSDRCENCQQVTYLKRNDFYKRTGIDKELNCF